MASIPRPRTPIDETLWRDSSFCRVHGVTQHMVMHYFYLSPFFDNTSSNGQLTMQLTHNPAAAARINSQADFDKAMKSMRGVEYVIAAGNEASGVWVIRKQLRKAPREVVLAGQKQKVEDVSILADYYIVGENIYQAPTVGAVLANRMLTITNDLRNTLKLAMSSTSLSSTPPPPPLAATDPPPSSQQPPPSSQSQARSQSAAPSTSATTTTTTSSTSSSTSTQRDAKLLYNALSLSVRHHGEFMDDHAPLLGDPGSLLQPGAAIGGGGSGGGGGGAGGAAASAAIKRGGTPVPPAPAAKGGLLGQVKK
ncbi:MED6 mediator sub complex component-domain-containing protein [Tricharina praecox]|uniref:MED6 mediator sub complex component-domain-containing protein n=1 Tax=Tricharina praecox TaxID=43433 RepID=UPI0022209ED1|nr:MED6 mediator sub complex component-domain-containing protein [Tricharina praecox]KAI5854895.1 MED6 mediator sub complex component-domain-containing protein [Tricharina praecox]